MEERSFKKYIILWLSQSVSGLGSSMTGEVGNIYRLLGIIS